MIDWEIKSDNRLMEKMHERAFQIARPLCFPIEIKWSGSTSSKSYLDGSIDHQKEGLEAYLNYEI